MISCIGTLPFTSHTQPIRKWISPNRNWEKRNLQLFQSRNHKKELFSCVAFSPKTETDERRRLEKRTFFISRDKYHDRRSSSNNNEKSYQTVVLTDWLSVKTDERTHSTYIWINCQFSLLFPSFSEIKTTRFARHIPNMPFDSNTTTEKINNKNKYWIRMRIGKDWKSGRTVHQSAVCISTIATTSNRRWTWTRREENFSALIKCSPSHGKSREKYILGNIFSELASTLSHNHRRRCLITRDTNSPEYPYCVNAINIFLFFVFVWGEKYRNRRVN